MLASLFRNSLTTSLSMSIVLIPLLFLSSKLNQFFVMKWKYWLWLMVAFRMLLPVNLSIMPARYTIKIPNRVVAAQVVPSAMLFTESSGPSAAPFHTIHFFQLLSIIWLIGMMLVAGFHLVSYWGCKKNYLRWSIRCVDQHILDQVKQIGRSMGVKKRPEIYICPNVPSPMILGFTRQFILLPDVPYDHSEVDYILKHELVHMKRCDVWYKLILLAVFAVHWYNPIGYLLLREATRDLEMLCDDFVIEGLGADECKRYSKVILATAHRRHYHTTVLSTSFHGSAKSLKDRLQNLLIPKRRRGTAAYLASCIAALLASGILICLPASAGTTVQLQDRTVHVPNGVQGIDVSSYQGDIDWKQVAKSDIHFVFIRATYGLETDSAFRMNAANARSGELDVGAWHYATFTDRDSMRQEAAFFLESLEGVELTLPAVLCIDTPTGLSKESMTGLCVEFLKIVGDAGYPVMLNTYAAYMENYLDAEQLHDIPKWIANYMDEPKLNQQFWQYSSAGTIDGIEGQVDINIAYTATS